jgi:hypothetical protein
VTGDHNIRYSGLFVTRPPITPICVKKRYAQTVKGVVARPLRS